MRLRTLTVARMCSKPSFYAVRRGRQLGVFNTWSECLAQTQGFPYAEFRKFATKAEAEEFVGRRSAAASLPSGHSKQAASVAKSLASGVKRAVRGAKSSASGPKLADSGAKSPKRATLDANVKSAPKAKGAAAEHAALKIHLKVPHAQPAESSAQGAKAPLRAAEIVYAYKIAGEGGVFSNLETLSELLGRLGNHELRVRGFSSSEEARKWSEPAADALAVVASARESTAFSLRKCADDLPALAAWCAFIEKGVRSAASAANCATERLQKTTALLEDEEELDEWLARHAAGFVARAARDGHPGMAADGTWTIFTDGACLRDQSGGMQAGVGVFFGDGNLLNVAVPLPRAAVDEPGSNQTNNQAELCAIVCALRLAQLVGMYAVALVSRAAAVAGIDAMPVSTLFDAHMPLSGPGTPHQAFIQRSLRVFEELLEPLAIRSGASAQETAALCHALASTAEAATAPLVILSDSQYSINSIVEWWPNKWTRRQGAPARADGGHIRNMRLIALAHTLHVHHAACLQGWGSAASLDVGVTIDKVKGHAGVHGNEAADRLANLGAKCVSRELSDLRADTTLVASHLPKFII